MNQFKKLIQYLARHRYGFTLFAFLVAAAVTGISCIWFMRGFEFVLKRRLDFDSVGAWCWLITPLLFLAASELIRRIAPCAAGTGIPQAIFAAKHLESETEKKLWPLFSPLTLGVKVLAILIALAAGASMGREGPTVHVGVCVFLVMLMGFQKLSGITFDLRSGVVAGGAAGLAAAFNTPLAGVTFAIEELTVDYFAGIKDFVVMAIIIAALSAKALTGEYGYFGRLLEPPGVPWLVILLIGISGGMLGTVFSTGIIRGQQFLDRYQESFYRYFVPVTLSIGLLLVAAMAGTRVLGPGNQVAQGLLKGDFSAWVMSYPLAKMSTTLLTYWSGLAGGIFAPSLSIGAGLGSGIGHCTNSSVAGCALLGMAAFLSGTIQAPITSFVIIFEMTGHHQMLLPVMLASLIAFMTARLLGAAHLYPTLSTRYQYLLNTAATQDSSGA